MNSEAKNLKILLVFLNIVLIICCSYLMYNGYKCLSGFIANDAKDGLRMLVMVTSYFLFPLSYMYFFYASYVNKPRKLFRLIAALIISIATIFNLIFISMNISSFLSNSSLGVYNALKSIVFIFPYDMIITNIVLLLLQIFNIITLFYPLNKFDELKNYFVSYGYFSFKIYEYLLLCILSIVCFVFIGDFFMSFNAIENVIYDPKYIYLMLYVLLVPVSALILFYTKIDTKLLKTKKNKIIYLSSIVGINILLTALLFIFEAIYPDFIIRIGKPLFVITFSVSLPIEIIMLLAISATTIIVSIIKFIKVFKHK